MGRKLLRSPREIAFRLSQEAGNLWLGWGFTPPSQLQSASLPLPPVETVVSALHGTAWATQVVAEAEAVLRREFSLLGGNTLRTDREIQWRRDYVHGRESGLDYFRRIPYLDAQACGDHKTIWELNRHQHLVVLAQAFLLTGRPEFQHDLWLQLESWLEQNPFCRGMNWTSALEVAFRALSWIWIERLVGTTMPGTLRPRFLQSLFSHARFLENNLSVYFSPNTHLQGEALALHALGLLFAGTPAGARWQARGHQLLEQMVLSHTRPDGGHFEQSSSYHVYATDMFLFHAALAPVSEAYLSRLREMARYLAALSGPSGEMPVLGDDDGGRLFHPYGNRRRFGRATLAACRLLLKDSPCHGDRADLEPLGFWWFGPSAASAMTPHSPLPGSSCQFADSGILVLDAPQTHAVVDIRGFGSGSAGHSHAHALHFTLQTPDGEDILLDPGTYTYVGEPEWRDRFRGTAFHNTVLLDQRDQADPGGPFRWNNLPRSELLQWDPAPWRLHARCCYRGLQHDRHLYWANEGVLFVLDHLTGDAGTIHDFAQNWHIGGPVKHLGPSLFELPAGVRLILPEDSPVVASGWHSPAPGVKHDLPVIQVQGRQAFPVLLAAAFVFPGVSQAVSLQVQESLEHVTLTLRDSRYTAVFPVSRA